MFEFKIENVAEALINQAKLFGCTIDVAWNKHMHSLITEKFTLEDVVDYIENMQIYKVIEDRDRNDNGVRYTLDDLKKIMMED